MALIQRLARTGWITHIKGNHRNHAILGVGDDPSDFLFSPTHQSLAKMSQGLKKLEGNLCLYCDGKTDAFDIDHFIPFPLYPMELAHNPVSAHPKCNRSKSDAVAARFHLEKWPLRFARQADDIAQIGRDAGIKFDAKTVDRVAHWAYQSGLANRTKVWLAPRRFESIDASYMERLRLN